MEMIATFRERFGEKRITEDLLLAAKIGMAFESKDYDTFLTLSKKQLQRFPDEWWVRASVASALACKYATTGEEQYKQESNAFLEEARALAQKSECLNEFEEFEERHRHRLRTRDVISRKEYGRKYRRGGSEANRG